MAHVEIIDLSLRDGVQSLWGMRIRAGMVTGAGRHLDRAGYHTVELPSGSFFSVLLPQHPRPRRHSPLPSELITGALQHSSARRIRLESGALSVDLRR